MNLGRLREAVPFFQRYITYSLNQQLWQSASIGHQNLTWLYTYLGELATSSATAQQALQFARQADDRFEEKDTLSLWAWTAHLQGHLGQATKAFQQAIALEQALSQQPYLDGLRGIWYADHLRRLGQTEEAYRITIANLKQWVYRQRWVKDESQCYRILGDLRSAAGFHDRARRYYNRALKLARKISNRAVLIEALLARGRWLAQQDSPEDARSDLEEALTYAVFGEYRLYEADVRIGLAWSHVTGKNLNAAHIEAERARQMSVEMGYYWGQVDAEVVLQQVANSES
jgi:tetratricopeptide (TPR) repeat protein